MIVNRIGDFGLAIAIFTLYYYFKTVDYGVVFALAGEMSKEKISFFSTTFGLLDFIGFFLFIGAVGKSAQLGLHT
jgi:NADH-quinone oxidoreductase subunit L